MFADRLNKTRKDRGLTAQNMADSLNIGIRNYRKYESGDAKPTLDGLSALSDILNVPIDYLLSKGFYGELEKFPEAKPLLSEELDKLLGKATLEKLNLSSTSKLPHIDFCQLASSLIRDFAFDEEKNKVTIHWRL